MKNITIAKYLLLLLFCLQANAQSLWGNLKKGPYNIGYKDTVLVSPTEKFSYNFAETPKPFFVHIWYPTTDTAPAKKFTFADYWTFTTNDSQKEILDGLKTMYLTNLGDPDAANKLQMLQMPVQRNAKPLAKKLPVIVYHHGSQGTGIDNNVFCEFMASHGFLVIAADYTLPSQMVPKLIPSTEFIHKYDLSKMDGAMMDKITLDFKVYELNNIKFIMDFIKKYPNADAKNITGIGHSYGAQRLLLMDQFSPKYFSKIITLHTTMEDQGIEETNATWAYEKEAIARGIKNFTTPKYIIAPAHKDSEKTIQPDFSFFKALPATTVITLKYPLKHNSFISEELALEAISNPSSKELATEKEYNEKVTNLCLGILKGDAAALKTSGDFVVTHYNH